jgi:hypothetical protein
MKITDLNSLSIEALWALHEEIASILATGMEAERMDDPAETSSRRSSSAMRPACALVCADVHDSSQLDRRGMTSDSWP